MKTITVDVLASDISEGVRFICNACPIARALARATGDVWFGDSYSFLRDRDDCEWKCSPIVTGFIKRFDAGEPVKPFSFQIEIPE